MKKGKLLKAIGKIFKSPLIRGVLKTIPLGNWAYEVADNISHFRNPEKKNDPAPHSAVSLLAQAVFLGIILYAFFTKQLTIDDVMNWIGPDDFKNFAPAAEVLTDSIPG